MLTVRPASVLGVVLFLSLSLAAAACGSTDDASQATSPAENTEDSASTAAADQPDADDSNVNTDESAEDQADGGGSESAGGTTFISEGTGEVVLSFDDGYTTTESIDCSFYQDQFETTFDSLTFYLSLDEAGETSFSSLTFVHPELGTLLASNADIVNSASFDGTSFQADLTVEVAQEGELVDVGVSVSGSCQ